MTEAPQELIDALTRQREAADDKIGVLHIKFGVGYVVVLVLAVLTTILNVDPTAVLWVAGLLCVSVATMHGLSIKKIDDRYNRDAHVLVRQWPDSA